MSGDFSLLSKTINGGVSSILGITILYPMDLVKTRLQIQRLDPNVKVSFIPFFRNTLRAEGLLGMYRGSSVSYVMVAPEKALYLASNDYFRNYLAAGSDQPLPVGKSIIAGALAAICTLTVQTPMELVKIQMQDATAKMSAKKNGLAIVADIVRTKGPLGLYQGTVATGCRDIVFSVILFPLFAYIKEKGPKKHEASLDTKNYWSFLAGSVTGCLAAFAATPFDVIKTRLQTSHAHYTGVLDAGYKILHTEGPRALFKGGLCRVMILAPMFGILQTVYFLNISERLIGIWKAQD